MDKKIAIIGVGNTLRRDDGVGIIILESLLKNYKRSEIDYLNFGAASFDLIHRLQNYSKALVIDGINANQASGRLIIFELSNAKYHYDNPVSSTHELDLKTLFELSRKFNIKTKIFVAGIQVEDVSFGQGLSEPVKNNLNKIVKEIVLFIDKKIK